MGSSPVTCNTSFLSVEGNLDLQLKRTRSEHLAQIIRDGEDRSDAVKTLTSDIAKQEQVILESDKQVIENEQISAKNQEATVVQVQKEMNGLLSAVAQLNPEDAPSTKAERVKQINSAIDSINATKNTPGSLLKSPLFAAAINAANAPAATPVNVRDAVIGTVGAAILGVPNGANVNATSVALRAVPGITPKAIAAANAAAAAHGATDDSVKQAAVQAIAGPLGVKAIQAEADAASTAASVRDAVTGGDNVITAQIKHIVITPVNDFTKINDSIDAAGIAAFKTSIEDVMRSVRSSKSSILTGIARKDSEIESIDSRIAEAQKQVDVTLTPMNEAFADLSQNYFQTTIGSSVLAMLLQQCYQLVAKALAQSENVSRMS